MCRTRLLSFLFVCSTLVSCWAQANMTSVGEGGITGVVLTEDGQLANGEKVCTEPGILSFSPWWERARTDAGQNKAPQTLIEALQRKPP